MPNSNQELPQFWVITEQRKRHSVEFPAQLVLDHLEAAGFRKWYSNRNDGDVIDIIRLDQGIADQLSPKQVNDFLRCGIQNAGNDRLAVDAAFKENHKKFTQESLYTNLTTVDLEPMRDGPGYSYIFFTNGWMRLNVGSDDRTLHPYSELPNPIFRESLERHVEGAGILGTVSFAYNGESDGKTSEFERFLRLAMRTQYNPEHSDLRFRSACSAIGFLMHRYCDHRVAVYCTDEIISEDRLEANGRTGKDIFAAAIAHMRSLQPFDGKRISFRTQFLWSALKHTHEIVQIQDPKPDFEVQEIFNEITSGFEVERKNQARFRIDGIHRPKIIITSNYAPRGSGASVDARLHPLEFSDHFGPTHTPKEEFGHQLFLDWDATEWSRFQDFMLGCLQAYLNMGRMLEPVDINFQRKQARNRVRDGMLDYMDADQMATMVRSSRDSKQGLLLSGLMNEYQIGSGDKEVNPTKFSKQLRVLMELHGIKVTVDRVWSGNARRYERYVRLEVTGITDANVLDCIRTQDAALQGQQGVSHAFADR